MEGGDNEEHTEKSKDRDEWVVDSDGEMSK